jgi:diguanylate cyclase (GGDEF)-like protein
VTNPADLGLRGRAWSIAAWLFAALLFVGSIALWFWSDERSGFTATYLFALFAVPVLLLAVSAPVRHVVLLAFASGVWALIWGVTKFATIPLLDPLSWSYAVGWNILALFGVLFPVVIFRESAMKEIVATFEGRIEKRQRERDELAASQSVARERVRSLQSEAEFISESYEMMKQIVGTLSAVELYELIRERVTACFHFRASYLVVLENAEAGAPCIAEIRDLLAKADETVKDEDAAIQGISTAVVSEKIPPALLALCDDFLRAPALSSATEDVGILTAHDEKGAYMVACGLPAGKELMGVLLFLDPDASGMGMADECWTKLRITARQLGLGLKRTALYRKVELMARTDGLTGLYVPWYFHQRLDEEVRRAVAGGTQFGLVMADIDHFKKINDTHGHAVGDDVLRITARLMRSSFREVDFICRYGGEEFTIILPEIDPPTVMMVAERLRKAVESHEGFPHGRVTTSVGVACFPRHAGTKEQLLEAADAALYASKHGGRNRVTEAKSGDGAGA